MSQPLLGNVAFRSLAASNICERLASSALVVLLGFQLFALTGRAEDLGWLGLVEALPGISLVLYGGHVADRHPRRTILLITSAGFTALAAALTAAQLILPGHAWPIYAVAFLQGIVRAFEDPAAAGIEAQVIPIDRLVQGTALLATSGRLAQVIGPAIGGIAYAALGPASTYAAIALLFALSLLSILPIPPASQPAIAPDPQPTLLRIAEGVRFVLHDQVLLGSMLLDLFAVFFGGATALLPAVATTVLHLGPIGFGVLRSAPAAGSMAAALLASRLLPERRAGAVLFWVIGGFGVAVIVFGLSRSLPLSIAALFVAGLCDGTSVVIRRAILRLASPEAMRGRIAAVKTLFVGSSNELGAFESGMAAAWLGVTPAIWSGGLVTLAIVLATAALAPRLRRMDLRAMTRA